MTNVILRKFPQSIKLEAHGPDRTDDRPLTKRLLYQLSYVGNELASAMEKLRCNGDSQANTIVG